MEQNASEKFVTTGLTFDDVLIAPRYSTVMPSEVEVGTRLTARISMNVPVLSSPMDTVTGQKRCQEPITVNDVPTPRDTSSSKKVLDIS